MTTCPCQTVLETTNNCVSLPPFLCCAAPTNRPVTCNAGAVQRRHAGQNIQRSVALRHGPWTPCEDQGFFLSKSRSARATMYPDTFSLLLTRAILETTEQLFAYRQASPALPEAPLHCQRRRQSARFQNPRRWHPRKPCLNPTRGKSFPTTSMKW